jgi:hypothetical protein
MAGSAIMPIVTSVAPTIDYADVRRGANSEGTTSNCDLAKRTQVLPKNFELFRGRL